MARPRLRGRIVSSVAKLLNVYPDAAHRTGTYTVNGVTFEVSLSNAHEARRWDALLRKEPETIRWIDEMMAPGQVFFDVGACIGNYSIYAAGRHPGLRVFAFEPEPHSLIQLMENARINRLPVTCCLLSISDRATPGWFHLTGDVEAGGSNHQFDAAERGAAVDVRHREFVMHSSSLDALVQDQVLPSPHHVKIDVDGLESSVLRGMRGLLGGSTLESVLCEVSGTPGQQQAVRAQFTDAGFSCLHEPSSSGENFIFHRRGRA